MNHWTRQTQGSVYIAHFSRPLGNHANPRAMANHYVGFAVDLAERIAVHEVGKGAKITAAAVEQGITFTWFAWDANLGVEKWLKKTKAVPHFCPCCATIHGWRCRSIATTMQLALPLGDTHDDFPAVPPLRMDWYEVATLKRWRMATAPVAAVLADDWDTGLL